MQVDRSELAQTAALNSPTAIPPARREQLMSQTAGQRLMPTRRQWVSYLLASGLSTATTRKAVFAFRH